MPGAHLAIDLGASSGRAILGILEGSPELVRLEEVHRFVHAGVPTPTGPVWNLTDIWQNIVTGLKNGADWCDKNEIRLRSIGVDTWGVDWAMVAASGELVSLPHCYRDPQNDPACEATLEIVGGFEQLYKRTGIQLMSINTLFQVAARMSADPGLFDVARHLIFLPDLFHFWLCGELSVERTIASTSSMLNVETGEWDSDLLQQIGLPDHLLELKIVEPGTQIGTLRAELAEQTGASETLRVVAPAGHDTGCAVAAVPVSPDRGDWVYLSSGTWSLLGAELDSPNTSAEAAAVPFTNERGVDGKIRFLKNITGLWMVQELRREFGESETDDISYEEIVAQAERAEPFRTLVDPSHAPFQSPGKMRQKIRDYAANSEQPEPETMGDLARCCFESLALCYWQTLTAMKDVLNNEVAEIYVVGGGSNNRLLNQMTADITGLPVIAGPAEATAVGNVLIQAMGCGEVTDLAAIRDLVNRSFEPERFEPELDEETRCELRASYLKIIDDFQAPPT